ncbi:6-phosphogluconolactonase [Hydrogenophaga sp.]|uniref:6-phosphogluconolactonase n=1 Tax=Hydrogenophaga sp. TaxID=1904254 RepID=UPI0025C4FB3A|nr:6-phosphogluconolactonase [Hydrogenophaga sp.]
MPRRPPRHLKEYHAKSAADLARGLAAQLANTLREAIEARGHALLAVSGGKSPIALFEALRQQSLNWANVSVILVDERCVAHDHADSNTTLVRQHLLQEQASVAALTPYFDSLADPLDDAALDRLVSQANRRLARLHWPIDVAVLGMGEDGHTASLFPDAPGLEKALRNSGPLAWVRPNAAPHARLTLTLPALLASRELVLFIGGEAKHTVYRQALLQADPALPVSLVLHQHQTPISVWLT